MNTRNIYIYILYYLIYNVCNIKHEFITLQNVNLTLNLTKNENLIYLKNYFKPFLKLMNTHGITNEERK